jgi:hypothetical protein
LWYSSPRRHRNPPETGTHQVEEGRESQQQEGQFVAKGEQIFVNAADQAKG